ncbi:MAG: IS66 family transposase [Serratia symbiotica]|nr:IS66 family transposase [Serratia symbiotica]
MYLSTQTATAEAARQRIGGLYVIAEERRGRPAVSQARAKLLLASHHAWRVDKSATLSQTSRLGEAFAYTLNQWDAWCDYADDGQAAPDNNAEERALRAVYLGKMISASAARPWWWARRHRGERGALRWGLLGTGTLNGIDPEAYLRHILSVLPAWPCNNVAELLPGNLELLTSY